MSPDEEGGGLNIFLGWKFEIKHLRYAVMAAEHGSFRRAAEAMLVQQSSLSRGIAHLEGCLGVVLFERGTRGVRATPAGAEILHTSRHLVETIEHMMLTAREIARGNVGRLTVGFYTSLSAGNLRASLVDYAGKFPGVQIRTIEGPRSRLFAALQSGTIDVAIVTGDPVPGIGHSIPLWAERILVALPEAHRLAANEVVHWTDLRNETILTSQQDPGPEIEEIVTAKAASRGKRPKVVGHHASHDNIKNLVSAGFGVGLMLEAHADDNPGGLVYREACDGSGPSRISYCAYWREDNGSPTLARFIGLLEQRYPSPPGLAEGSNAAPTEAPA